MISVAGRCARCAPANVSSDARAYIVCRWLLFLADRGQNAHNPVGCNRVSTGVAGHEFADASEEPVWAASDVPAPTVTPVAESLLPLVDDSTVKTQYVYTYQSGEREGPPSYPVKPGVCNYGLRVASLALSGLMPLSG